MRRCQNFRAPPSEGDSEPHIPIRKSVLLQLSTSAIRINSIQPLTHQVTNCMFNKIAIARIAPIVYQLLSPVPNLLEILKLPRFCLFFVLLNLLSSTCEWMGKTFLCKRHESDFFHEEKRHSHG